MPMIDFKILREQLRWQEVLELVGSQWQVLPNGGCRTSCPVLCSHGRQARRMVAMTHDGCWYCHKCHKMGDLIDYFALAVEATTYDAAIEMCERLSIKVPFVQKGKFYYASPGNGKGNGEEAR